MVKYFSVATDPLTADETNAFKEALGKGPGWWHWLPNYWLIKDPSEKLTAASIRDSLKNVAAASRCIVLEVEPKKWAALTKPGADGKDMGAWLHKTWDAE